MAESRARKTNDQFSTIEPQTLSEYLGVLRASKKLTLREVEEATERNVSNAYLSQLEKGAIKKPSPHILYSLSEAYSVPYETLMEKAGYLHATRGSDPSDTGTVKHGRLATFADEHLTPSEEEELLRYLAFLRTQTRSRKK